MKLGMVFPGYGSQFVGMAKEFYDKERLVQEYFEEASNCLNQNFVKLCFASSDKELAEISNAHTSIFLVSSSVLRLLKERYNIVPDIVAGYEVGEYGAVFASGGINFPDGLYLLKKRAQFIEEVSQEKPGGMLKIMDFDLALLEAIVKKYNNPDSLDAVAEITAYDSSTQFCVSGTQKEVEYVKNDVEEKGGKTFMLKTKCPFNSRLLGSVEKILLLYMEKVDFHNLNIPLIRNQDALAISTAEEVKNTLIKQVSKPILWWQSMQQFQDCDLIVEVAPGTVLSEGIRWIMPHKQVFSINTYTDIDILLRFLDREIIANF